MPILRTSEIKKHLQIDEGVIPTGQQIKDLQKVLLGIAEDIIDFCDKHGIYYTLGGGTALGAYRQQGFIPWDDDIDINMPRKDFDRFMDLFPKFYGEKYWVQSPDSPKGLGIMMGLVRKKGTITQLPWHFGDEHGAFVDIFPLENVPDNPIMRFLFGVLVDFVALCLSCRIFYEKRDVYRVIIRQNPKLKPAYYFKTAIGFLCSWGSMAFWSRLSDRVCSSYKNSKSRYVTVPAGRHHYFGEMMTREDLTGERYAAFEGHRWRIPHNAELFFEKLYGPGYMIPDAPEKREYHAYVKFDLGTASQGLSG